MPGPGFYKCCRILGPGLINKSEDGGATGLFDLGDLTFDCHRLSYFTGQVRDVNRRGLAINGLHLVHLNQYFFQIDIAIRADLANPDKDRIAFLVFCLDIALVHKTLDPVVNLGEHPKSSKTLHFCLVGLSFLNIGKVASCTKPINNHVIIFHCFHHTQRGVPIVCIVAILSCYNVAYRNKADGLLLGVVMLKFIVSDITEKFFLER